MTELNKKLRREINHRLELDKYSRGRAIVIELDPAGLISFSWKGTRRRYTATIGWVMQKTIEAEIERERRRPTRRSWVQKFKGSRL